MTASHADILSDLKNYSSCNDDLAITVRKTVLEPFQVDLSRPESIKPSPSPQAFKQMAVRLAPLAMRIVNQNSETFTKLKKENLSKDLYTVAVNCLIDSSFYALTALRHMNTLTTLKPLDIEKTTSNIISKIVDLGEYGRALHELAKFRLLLASVMKVSLSSSKPSKDNNKSTKTTSSISGHLSALRESSTNTIGNSLSSSIVPEIIISNQWEQDTINKYHDLFQFPLDTTVNDRTMILLVLAYQMNCIRCFCELKDGALAKCIPYLFEKPGNFLDWCKQLLSVDSTIASKQLDGIQKILSKVAKSYPQNEENAYYSYTLQCLALKSFLVSKTKPLKSIFDHFVRCSLTYEKATNRKTLRDLLQSFEPNAEDILELNSYFVLCDFYAYVSRKLKSYKGAFYAYKHMIRPIRIMIGKPGKHAYYYAAYAATAKLSLGSVQMDKMVLDHIYIDISTTFKEAVSCIELMQSTIDNVQSQDDQSAQALLAFCKSADSFRQSSKRFYEFVLDKAIHNVTVSANDPFRTPPRAGEMVTPSNFGTWNAVIPQLNKMLQSFSDCISSGIRMIKTKFADFKQKFQMDTIMTTFVDIMILLARIQFKVEDESTYYKALEYLHKAEDLCIIMKYNAGYSWISGSYYSMGTAMIKVDMYSKAIYPIRKSCTLLEKSIECDSSDESKLELSTRYEILGTCCFKNKDYEDAGKAYRLGLRQIPTSKIKNFVDQGNSTAVSTIMENDRLIPKLMDRFLRTSIIDPKQESVTFASEHLDLSNFNLIQQSIIYECELKVWSVLSLKTKLNRFQLFIAEKLLEVYEPTSYPLRRARILLERVRIERSNNNDRHSCLRNALKCAIEAYELLKLSEYAEDGNLLYYRRHYLALATSWIAICGHELKEKVPCSFSLPIQHWGVLLKNINAVYDSSTTSLADKQQVYSEIDDVDKLYAHLQMLADLFGIIGQYTYQINALRLLLKLNNGFRNTKIDHISESIIITCEIAKIYCTLGYTRKALNEYNQAKKAISNNKCNAFAELTFLVSYSQYLAIISEFDKSKETFDKAKCVWIHRLMDESKNTQQTSKQFVTRSIILSEAYIAKSMLRSDTLDNAINNTTTALQILNRCIKTFQNEEREAGPVSDPFSEDGTKKKHEVQSVSKAVFRESQWKLAEKTGKCMEIICQLYLTKGSWNEAKYFVRQGIGLAQRLQSKSMLYYAYICSSDFNLRYGELDESEKDLEKALQYKPDNYNPLHNQVKLNISMANLAIARKMYDEAIVMYDEANKALETLSDSKYIVTLEKLTDVKEDTKSNDDMDIDTKNECIPLQRMQTSNVIQKATIYAYKDEHTTGVSLLEALEDSGLSFDEFQFNTTMGHLKLKLTLDEISKHNSLKQQDIKCLPAMNYISRVARHRIVEDDGNINDKLRDLWDKLTYSLEKMMIAFQSGINRERLMAVNKLCNDTGFAIFLKNQIEIKTRELVNNNAWSSAYYLEMAKGLHARRLIQTCLTEKVQKMSGYKPPSENSWPPDETENDHRKSRLTTLSTTPDWLQSHLLTLSEHYSKDHLLDDAQFQQEYVDIIPDNWTICSLTMDLEHNTLYAVQLRAGEAPFVIKIPLSRITKKLGSDQNTCDSFQEAEAELKSIIQESDDTIQYSAQCKRPEEVKQWWAKRSSLDSRLEILLARVQEWFGGFKGILSGQRNESLEDVKKFCEQLNELVHKIVMKLSSKKAKVEFSLHFCRIVLQLGQFPNAKELEDIAYFALSCYEDHSIYINFDQVSKEITKGLSNIISSYHNNVARKGIDADSSMPNDHVILILDKYMQMLPMENIPILRKQAVSRLPCLSFLRDRILYAQSKKASNGSGGNKMKNKENAGNDLHLSKKNTFYVLNPSGDLVDTQKEFETLFKSFPQWGGIIGTAPMELQCKDALQSRDLYMYFGHSAGQSFLRGNIVRNLPKCAVSLLMGCSSGRMETNGEYDPHGYILNYLVAGSPAVVGNLWDVTDRSIDNVTKHMLETWGVIDKSKGKSLVQAVVESRDKCNLKYLIGAAPVVYGVPVYL